jgi:hypothetical protein
MNDLERTVRQFHDSWDLRDPERGVAVIAPYCQFEDVARGEAQIGPDGYRADDHRWRAAFPDGEVKVVTVITGGDGPDGWAAVEFLNRGTQTGNHCLDAERPKEGGLGVRDPAAQFGMVGVGVHHVGQGGSPAGARDRCDAEIAAPNDL